jgi:hypothetical protein
MTPSASRRVAAQMHEVSNIRSRKEQKAHLHDQSILRQLLQRQGLQHPLQQRRRGGRASPRWWILRGGLASDRTTHREHGCVCQKSSLIRCCASPKSSLRGRGRRCCANDHQSNQLLGPSLEPWKDLQTTNQHPSKRKAEAKRRTTLQTTLIHQITLSVQLAQSVGSLLVDTREVGLVVADIVSVAMRRICTFVS